MSVGFSNSMSILAWVCWLPPLGIEYGTWARWFSSCEGKGKGEKRERGESWVGNKSRSVTGI